MRLAHLRLRCRCAANFPQVEKSLLRFCGCGNSNSVRSRLTTMPSTIRRLRSSAFSFKMRLAHLRLCCRYVSQTFPRLKKSLLLFCGRGNSNSARLRLRLMTMPSTIRRLRSSVFSFKNASGPLAPPLPVCSKLSPGRKKLSPLMRMRQLKQRLFALDDYAFHNSMALVIRILLQKYVWPACASAAGV